MALTNFRTGATMEFTGSGLSGAAVVEIKRLRPGGLAGSGWIWLSATCTGDAQALGPPSLKIQLITDMICTVKGNFVGRAHCKTQKKNNVR